MNKDSVLTPFFRTIDRIFFGIKEWDEPKEQSPFCDSDCEEEFDLEEL